MKSFTIRFDSVDDVIRFNKIANSYDGKIEIIDGQNIVDTKHILWLLSLDLSKNLIMNVYMNSKKFNTIVKKLKEFEK